ncbi:DNA recombination protein RmuC [Silvimonas terrae]|uniref:DNA recombination protein RmuC n=1 Tax=Silvimonas terrae TaxID=300266 RepID=A0A840RDV8_9NEIS|nr:DNA recombination protein RmuC [Silvimonas terrae]MBB5190550.1 DNA recombination protein RmuC [Silvimonas terrae]
MIDLLFGVTTLVALLAGVLVVFRLQQLARIQEQVVEALASELHASQREILNQFHAGLARQAETTHTALTQHASLLNTAITRSGEQLRSNMGEAFDRLRAGVSTELNQTRSALERLQITQTESLSTLRLALTTAQGESREQIMRQLAEISESLQSKQDTLREEVLVKLAQMLAEQSRREMDQLREALALTSTQLTQSVAQLTQTADQRLAEISGKVSERLDEGFKKTNETFANVMARLATIDEAQKKIDGLTTNVVSLQELLGDKRSRGAFGEVQLESLVRNVLPPQVYEMQSTLSNGTRVDCLLKLPEPTGLVAVDAKFPLENYHRMFEAGEDRTAAQRAFRADIKKHIDDISAKYIIPNETADGAVMFVPAEAVFAEIHAYHAELVNHAMKQRVWIVSPTTLMAVLNTARAVIKDVETRKQVHIIKEALGRLGTEFTRFDDRMKKLATHIRQAHEDAQNVAITSEKISRRFEEIEQVRLDEPLLEQPPATTAAALPHLQEALQDEE